MQMLTLAPKFKLAAPSWVKPLSLAENCSFLAGKVAEVALLFYEEKACLAYTNHDLPLSLTELPLSWHVHLPVDLNWQNSKEAALNCALLMQRVGFLKVKQAVLHPPVGAYTDVELKKLLKSFVKTWCSQGLDSKQLVLENLPEHSAGQMLELAGELSTAICFDMAHFLIHCKLNKNSLLNEALELAAQCSIVHLCAPKVAGNYPVGGGEHEALTCLSKEEQLWAKACCSKLPEGTTVVMEIFDWQKILDSYPLLLSWLAAP